MIYVVDDDSSIRDTVVAVLSEHGYGATAFAGAREALAAAAGEAPECVVSDILMPGMDGFAFFREYATRFPGRSTPFVFLSSQSADEVVIRGLESGADEYLVKPIRPALLVARLRAVLARRPRTAQAAFVGDLARMPLMRVLQFCEHQGLTGEIRVRTPDAAVSIRLRSGEIAEGDLEYLDRVFEVREGDFTIFVSPVDFGEIAEGAAARPAPLALEKPMGQLSGVRLDNRLFQIQTEFTLLPAPAYTTIVVLDGRTVHKKSTPADLSLSRAGLESAMSAQHQEIELNLRKKIGLDAGPPAAAPSPSVAQEPSADTSIAAGASTAERCARLLDDGYEHLREKDYARALAAWEQAAQLDPENRTLQLNLEILRKKMEK